MCQVRNFISLILAVAALAACGADDHQASQSAVGRNFDELASAVAGCADSLSSCKREASDETETAACQEEFSSCRTRAGKEAENALADAISTCQERASACRADASTDDSKDGCATTLRTCVGEATAQAHDDSAEDGGPSGRAHAPTYQCFGQLRECIDDDKAPKECAAAARACVIAAVQPADAGRPSTKPPAAGHASDAGRGGSSGAGTAGAGGKASAGGKAGAAGEHTSAGQGGAAGTRGSAGSGGAGGANGGGAGGAGGVSDVARECMAAHEACLMSGEKPMDCAKQQRKCVKADGGEDEP